MVEAKAASPLQDAPRTSGPMLPIESEVARGLRFMHLLAVAAERQDGETVRLIEELSKLLIARGVISETEWAEALQRQDLPDLPL